MRDHMSTKEKILEHLSHEAASDADMAEAFHMPEASVRRTRNELVKEGVVARVAVTVPAVWQLMSKPVVEKISPPMKQAQAVAEEPVATPRVRKKRVVTMRDTGEKRSVPDAERPVPSQYCVF
jgi:DNA-binding IclR family transcriptional regulator